MQHHIDTTHIAKDTVEAIAIGSGIISFIQAVAAIFTEINPILFGMSMAITIILGAPKVLKSAKFRIAKFRRWLRAREEKRLLSNSHNDITRDIYD